MLDRSEQARRRADNVARTEPPKHVETGMEARQGFIGRPIFYVLIGGLILAALFLVGTQIWSMTQPPPAEGALGSDISVPAVGAPPAAERSPADAAPPAEALPPAGIVPPAGMPASALAPGGN